MSRSKLCKILLVFTGGNSDKSQMHTFIYKYMSQNPKFHFCVFLYYSKLSGLFPVSPQKAIN